MVSNYPPGTWEGDPRAPWNEDSEALEAAEALIVERIEDLTGRELYNSWTIDPDSVMDAFSLRVNVFDTCDMSVPWTDLDEGIQQVWEEMARLVIKLGLAYLSTDLVDEALRDGKL